MKQTRRPKQAKCVYCNEVSENCILVAPEMRVTYKCLECTAKERKHKPIN